MRRIVQYILAGVLLSTSTFCSKSDNGGTTTTGDAVPSAAELVFPESNSECTAGTVINDTESTITFTWKATTNTASYEINVRNLDLNQTVKTTVTSNTAQVQLVQNTPYEWYVVSKSSANKTTTSTKWRFYNAGTGVENYTPFPATAVNPTRGQSVNATTTVTLEWSGSDVDNDIDDFEILLGTSSTSLASLGTTAQNTKAVIVTSGQTYYWRVLTTDKTGNVSQSEIFEFRVL